MLSVFWVSFINYGIIQFLACYDARNSKIPLFESLFKGLYTDINSLWFNDCGVTIVSIMFSNAYFPLIEFAYTLALRIFWRMVDQRTIWPNDPKDTHCKTIQAFLDVYSGDNFEFHYKYSYLLVVVFVTFTFGAAIPILFPIAFLSMVIFYLTERIMIVYCYREPPMYGSETNRRALSIMKFAPVIYCLAGIWIFSNQQVFRNSVDPNKGPELFSNKNHNIEQFFT